MADKIIKTSNIPLLDNVIHYLKKLALETVVKDQVLADSYETTESRKNFDVYKMCKLNTVRYEYFDYEYEDLLETSVHPREIYDILVDKFNAPDNIRKELLEVKKKQVIEDYEELNNYYRMLCGLPDIGDDYNIYVSEDYLTEDDYVFVDTSVPIQYMSENEQDFLYSIGVIDEYIKTYPNKKYLNFLGSRKIEPLTARMTKPFGMLYMPTDGIPMEVYSRWMNKFNVNRVFVLKTIYNSHAFIDENPYYEKFIAMFIIIQTMLDIISELPDFIIKRDIFDLEMIKLIFKSYDVEYFSNIPLNYQQAIVRNINKLIEFKSTSTSIINICSLFGCDNVTVFKYYLFKDRVKNEDGTFAFNENEFDNYKFKFIKCPIDENIDDYIKSNNNYLIYSDVTLGDKWWDGGLDHKYVEKMIKEHEFNYLQSKYLSVDCVFSMTEILFQLVYFYNMMFDNVRSEELLRVRLFNLSNRYSFRLTDVFCFLFALGYIYYGLSDDLLFDQSKVLYVKGFNFSTDMEELANYVNSKYYTLEDLGVADFVTFEKKDRIFTYKQLSDVFINNKNIYNHIVHEMRHASNKRIYDIYKKLFDSMMIVELTSDFFVKSNGELAKTFTDYLEDRDKILYENLIDIKSMETQEERQQAASTLIDDIIYVLEHQYLTDVAFNKIYRCFPTADANSIIVYIRELVEFFKSYKVQIDQMNIIYLLDDEYENWCGAIDDVLIKVNMSPSSCQNGKEYAKIHDSMIPKQENNVVEELFIKSDWMKNRPIYDNGSPKEVKTTKTIFRPIDGHIPQELVSIIETYN